MSADSHELQLLVWDVPPAVECGERFRAHVGVKCKSACQPGQWTVEVYDHDQQLIATGTIGDEVWPGTSGLYFAELALIAPPVEGMYTYEALVREATEAPAEDASAHVTTHPAGFSVRAVPPGDCRLRVQAVARGSQAPVAGLKVVMHPYRALTDERGVAELRVPRGPFRLFVTGRNFVPFRVEGELTSDLTVRAEVEPDTGTSDAELWP